MQRQTNSHIAMNIQMDLSPKNEFYAQHLYRIAQEALSNAIRHAKAKEIVLCWYKGGDHVVLSVRDNGIGLRTEQTDKPKGIGLTVMHSRAQTIGANLKIQTCKEKGTEVRITLMSGWNSTKREER